MNMSNKIIVIPEKRIIKLEELRKLPRMAHKDKER